MKVPGLQVGKTDHFDVCGVELRDVRAGDGVAGYEARGNALAAQKMRQHRGGGLVERTAAGDAENERLRAREVEALRQRRGLRRRYGNGRMVIREIVDDFESNLFDVHALLVFEHAAIDIHLREDQPRHRHLVVIGRQRMTGEKRLRLVGGFVGIAGKQPLVEALLRRQRRPVAEQDVQEFQALDMAPDDHEANGQRRREEESDRTPQPGPERCRADNRNRRQGPSVVRR